jgi:phosphoinositide-3-kinase regulatory subunit 4
MVKSLLEQGLKDSEEFVIQRTLLTLSNMIDIGLLDRHQIRYFLNDHVAPLLCHPSLWIRHGATNFVSTICKQALRRSQSNPKQSTTADSMTSLSTADILSSIIPIISKYLTRTDLTQFEYPEILLQCVKTPLRRSIYNCVAQDGRSDHLFLFLTQRSEIRLLANQNYPPGYFDSPDSGIQQLFEKLCKLGLNEDDEEKLLAMRDFMDKTRMSRLSSSLHAIELTNSNFGSVPTIGTVSTDPNKTRENFMFKDGSISIAKESKYSHVIDLSLKQLPVRVNKPAPASDELYVDSNESQTKGETNAVRTADAETEANQKRHIVRKPSQNTVQALATQNLIHDQFETCLNKFDGLVNRYVLLYDDYKYRTSRTKQTRETINSSLSSNLISFQALKWKPKGYLIVHSNEHTREITKLCRSNDSTYFATCSSADSVVKLWSTDNLLDGKSGFFKSRFTHDRFSMDSSSSSRPQCMTFFENTSLGILTDDFRFFKIDFDSSKRQYRMFSDTKLFKSGFCACISKPKQRLDSVNNYNDQSVFFYLRKPLAKTCTKCDSIYAAPAIHPTDMIYIDDTSPTWPTATVNSSDYHLGSYVRGLFVYASSSGYATCVDMRTKSKVYDLKFDLRKGFVTVLKFSIIKFLLLKILFVT